MDEIKLDPEEVLQHLKYILGPQISPTREELKIFTEELQNLMYNDIKRLEQEKSIPREQICSCKCHSIQSEELIDCILSDCDENSSTSTLRTETSSQPPLTSHADKPPPSFIRPWKTQPPTSARSGKEDPVKLYHRYQSIWSRNKIPGENNHAGLRWHVRGRMLGQQPEPRDKHECSLKCKCKCGAKTGPRPRCPCLCPCCSNNRKYVFNCKKTLGHCPNLRIKVTLSQPQSSVLSVVVKKCEESSKRKKKKWSFI